MYVTLASRSPVEALAQVRIQELEQKAQELLAMKAALEHLVGCCHDDDRPDCLILETLASDSPDAMPGRPNSAKFQGGTTALDAR